MTTRISCRLNGLICHLSGFSVLVVRLVQVSGVSCVSHDAVRLVPGPNAVPLSRAPMKSLGSSLRIGSRSPLCHSFVPTYVLGSLSLTCLTRSRCPPTQCLLYGVSFPDDNPRCSGVKILDKIVSANRTIFCVQYRPYAALNVMPPASRAYLVTRKLSVSHRPWQDLPILA